MDNNVPTIQPLFPYGVSQPRLYPFSLLPRPPTIRITYKPATPEEEAAYLEDFRFLLTVTDDYGKPVFDFSTLKTLAEQDIPVEWLKTVGMSIDADGRRICHGGKTAISIITAYHYGIPAEYVVASQRLSRQEECGIVLENALAYPSIPLDFLETIHVVSDTAGNPVLTMTDARQLHTAGIPAEYIVSVATLINTEDLVKDYTRKIMRYAQLELSVEELEQFQDTEKPNAVITYPTKDDNNGKKAFETKESLALYKQYRAEYDVWVRVTAREEELYRAIEASSSWSFGAFAGHGDGTSFVLGEPPADETNPETLEKYRLDVGDTEFADVLSNFLPDATIFLHTCFGGRGQEYETNIANFVHGSAPWTNVLASMFIFSTNDIHVQSVYPFRATIQGWKDINTPAPLLEATYYIPSTSEEFAKVIENKH
jgi:hypothetical protein